MSNPILLKSLINCKITTYYNYVT